MQIIQVNLTSLDPQPLKSGTSLEFTFSVEWEPSETPYARRFERYLDYSFFEHQVRCQSLNLPSVWAFTAFGFSSAGACFERNLDYSFFRHQVQRQDLSIHSVWGVNPRVQH